MNNNISIRLKTLRKQLAYSASKVVNILSNIDKKYSVQTLYKWEEGAVIPNLITLHALSKIYKCPLSYLVDGENLEYRRLTANERYLLNLYRNDFLFRSIAVQILKKAVRDTK